MRISLQEAYTILGLEEGASEADVRKAYKKSALMYHPDKNASAEATAQFQRISAAYKRITEPSYAEDEDDNIDVAEMAEMFNAMFGAFVHPNFFQSMFDCDLPDSEYDDDDIDDENGYDDNFFDSQFSFDEHDFEAAILEHLLQSHHFSTCYENDSDDDFDEEKGMFTSLHCNDARKSQTSRKSNSKKNRKKKMRKKKKAASSGATVPEHEQTGAPVDHETFEDTHNPIQPSTHQEASAFEIGQQVLVYGKWQGIVRFMGPTHYAKGDWIGVELNEAVGKNSGTVRGVKYFECAVNHGLMVRADDIEVGNAGMSREV